MKFKLIIFLSSLISLSLTAQNTVQWSDSIIVASTPLAITAPRVTLLDDGTPLFTWGTSGSPQTLWSSRYENDTFTTPVSIVQGSLPPDLFGFGGYDVAVSGSTVFVVYEKNQLGILLARSDDDGVSFSPPTTVQSAVSGGYATLSSLTIDGTGNPVVSYILDKNGAIYQVRRSTDGGITFGDPVLANAPAPGGQVCECCEADMMASGDSIWMVYRNNNQNLRDIWVTRSTNLASSFDLATDVDSTDWILGFCPIAGPRLARSGNTLVTSWMSGASGKNRVHLSTVHAGTMQSGVQLDFPPLNDLSHQSQADVTASGDTIGLVFMETNRDIRFHYSTNGTAGLQQESARFNDGTHTLQYPSIDFRNGVFHLVYSDPTSDKILYRKGTVTASSAAAEPKVGVAVSIAPNPTSGWITVHAGGEEISALAIRDVQGHTVYQQKTVSAASTSINVDLNMLPAGTYIIQVKTATAWHLGKLVLQ